MTAREATVERAALLGTLVLQATLRVLYAFHHCVNSDEPQHLHVAWGWTQGLLQYRDVFDNHAPLTHLLSAPLIAWIGESAQIVSLMRLAMIPLVALTLWAMYRIGCRLYSPRVALWTVAVGGLWPDFIRGSVEYRPDIMWMAAWLAAMAMFLTGRWTPARSFVGGVLLGIAMGASFKTIQLLVSLAAAALVTWALLRRSGSRIETRRVIANGLGTLAGLLIVPALIALLFLSLGAWRPFLQGTLLHNLVPGLGLWSTPSLRLLVFPVAVPLLVLGGRLLLVRAPSEEIGVRRSVLLLTTGFYFAAVESYWPLIKGQDFLPFFPVAALLVVPGAMALLGYLTRRAPAPGGGRGSPRLSVAIWLVPALFAMFEVTATLRAEPAWRNAGINHQAFLSDVLRLTRSGEYVMDLKGDAVFRPRPFYYALETVTLERLSLGLITDSIAEGIVATRTRVAFVDNDRLPPAARAFLNAHFVLIGRLRVVGCRLGNADADTAGTRSFEVIFPERFVVVSSRGNARGWLDGSPYNGARDLAPGLHEYRPGPDEGEIAVMWARADERGFSPFQQGDSP